MTITGISLTPLQHFSTSSDGLLFNQVKDNLDGGKIQQGLTLFNDYAAQSLLICAFIFSG
ncbi:hypothetical protein SEHO0A_01514 [Salmonella enterica subsp. houtenae str. ATCC BAA-1581]|nr:hypothetical protein SEHO0A_01514 [Salmonella enterica subsp. houtenae str. ATCC BAA-1581]